MVIGVITDFMAIQHDTFDDIGMVTHSLANQKKRCDDIEILQLVKQSLCHDRVGAVIKGEGYTWLQPVSFYDLWHSDFPLLFHHIPACYEQSIFQRRAS
jgi:hypothetical protein